MDRQVDQAHIIMPYAFPKARSLEFFLSQIWIFSDPSRGRLVLSAIIALGGAG